MTSTESISLGQDARKAPEESGSASWAELRSQHCNMGEFIGGVCCTEKRLRKFNQLEPCDLEGRQFSGEINLARY